MGDTSPNSQLLMRRIAALEARLEAQDQMAEAADLTQQTVNRETIVRNIFAGTRSTNYQEHISPFKPYPKWLYTHATAKELALGCPFRQVEVFNVQDDEALRARGDWFDSPADVPLPAGWGEPAAPFVTPTEALSNMTPREVAAPAPELNPAAQAVKRRGRPPKKAAVEESE